MLSASMKKNVAALHLTVTETSTQLQRFLLPKQSVARVHNQLLPVIQQLSGRNLDGVRRSPCCTAWQPAHTEAVVLEPYDQPAVGGRPHHSAPTPPGLPPPGRTPRAPRPGTQWRTSTSRPSRGRGAGSDEPLWGPGGSGLHTTPVPIVTRLQGPEPRHDRLVNELTSVATARTQSGAMNSAVTSGVDLRVCAPICTACTEHRRDHRPSRAPHRAAAMALHYSYEAVGRPRVDNDHTPSTLPDERTALGSRGLGVLTGDPPNASPPCGGHRPALLRNQNTACAPNTRPLHPGR